MKLVGAMEGIINSLQCHWYGRKQTRYLEDLAFSEAMRRFEEVNERYGYMHHYFHQLCPAPVRAHRAYFKQNQRGFGEDAFHAMWWLLLREFRSARCLEIGVYRGQVISLWALIAHALGDMCDVHGISPFTATGDAVSSYREDIDYEADTLATFESFGLPRPTLIKALSTDSKAKTHISVGHWDLIYIDGSHDYEIVLGDYQLCRKHLNTGGLLVLDDASASTLFRPPRFAFAGHPGPSRVAAEFAAKELVFLGAIGHNNVFRKPGLTAERG